ncbi:MAG: LysE family translocator [Proteobacteria bacterium]|nr:LysE family translocator [Pseudomonadota bacterium]MBU1581538.1 LysE family translocator [Pseudomonadota bacterium]MBU2453105.1 LysE family translocator [Pseudomonadota bacterium]MBU2629195.1 LysE family translocator [Pseudomonadota bacterium]
MFGIENYLGFIMAAVILNLTPGADTLYILTRSVSQGKNAGLVSVAGIMSGCIVHVLCAAFGLSMILSTSVMIFTLVKWTGALYLIYLGLKLVFQKSKAFETSPLEETVSDLKKIYKQGVLTNVLNPKVGLFFLSFLPQFINPDHVNGPMPFLILGTTFLVTGTLWCLFLTRTAAKMTNTLRHNKIAGALLQKLSGIIFIGFGLKLAFGKD